ncbi:hypothetical protein HK103_007367 [Boothiomyces macroporosus]|uniref:Large ribosomal subunit protein mL44 n=1 Tax=Boothiomyces macroporosus TaxID=261099 RepID=A0AAD5UMX4_9FUNG|nr:hypothetical protein HK103_007367 [Boothiomyces macroporosus]
MISIGRIIKRNSVFNQLKFISGVANANTTTNAPELEVSSTPANLAAFSARTGIKFDNQNILLEALTHISYKEKPEKSPKYQLIGSKILQMYVTEYVLHKYPALPAPVCASIVEAFVGNASLANVGKESEQESKVKLGTPLVRSWIVESLVGAIYEHQGPLAAKQLIQTHILTRSVDTELHVDAYVKVSKPRVLLTELIRKLNKPKPVARLLKETGRFSSTPTFVVGMYSGMEKIGEGYGSSLQMAETRVRLSDD